MTYAEEMLAERITRRAKQIGDSRGDPNWWRFVDEARAAIADRNPEGGDAKQAPSRSDESGGAEGNRP